jgi:hypothetical protein
LLQAYCRGAKLTRNNNRRRNAPALVMRPTRSIAFVSALALIASARADDATAPVTARPELRAAIHILKTRHMNRDSAD